MSKPLSQPGSIALIYGPMYSGKTTELLRLVQRQELAGKRCVLIKYKADTRYDDESVITHDSKKGSCQTYKADRLADVAPRIFSPDVDVIGIDEGQFYPDLAETSERLAKNGKIVIVAALNARFDRKPFEQVSLLIAYANEHHFLTAVCDCGVDATFTFREASDVEEVLIGGKKEYSACCRMCYYRKEKAMHDAENIELPGTKPAKKPRLSNQLSPFKPDFASKSPVPAN
ncbi:unnamed protein product, partial [Mesorhabditis spiculigera]